MPTFGFYINKKKIDTLRGANPTTLYQKVEYWAAKAKSTAGSGGDGVFVDRKSYGPEIEASEREFLSQILHYAERVILAFFRRICYFSKNPVKWLTLWCEPFCLPHIGCERVENELLSVSVPPKYRLFKWLL